MTRAKDELDLIVPDAVVDCFERRGWRERVQEANRPTKKSNSTTDVAASLLRMWR